MGSLPDLLPTGRKRTWEQETSEATELVTERLNLEKAFCGLIDLPRAAALRTPATKPEVDKRVVSFFLSEVTQGKSEQVRNQLKSGLLYELALFIGLPREGAVSADETFPSEKIPRSAIGHMLDVSFVPLSSNSSGELLAPQKAAPGRWTSATGPPTGWNC